MGFTLSGNNFFTFLSYISPFLLAFTFIFIGFINSEPLKPLVYLGCLLATMLPVVFLLKMGSDSKPSMNAMCGIFDILNDEYYRPTISVYFSVFTLVYTFIPMLLSGHVNYYLITLIFIIMFGDISTKLRYNCVRMVSVGASIVTGMLLGGITSFAIYQTDKDLVFFGGSPSNNVTCSKPSKNTFKCSVYKNGQLLKTL